MRLADSFLVDAPPADLSAGPALPCWRAELDLEFARTGSIGSLSARLPEFAARTALTRCLHRGPLRVQKALYPEGRDICHAVILHPPAGIAGGDELDISIHVMEDAHAVLTTPGAAKWYKANGRGAKQTIRLRIENGAHLDWLPLENILFDGAEARMELQIDCAPDASAIGWDACVLGRQAAGETWREGLLTSETGLRVGGALRWVERFELASESPLRAAACALDRQPVFANLWAVGPAVTEALAESLAPKLPWNRAVRAGVTCLRSADDASGLLLLRVLGRHVEAIHALMRAAWMALRLALHGVAGKPLRIWAT